MRQRRIQRLLLRADVALEAGCEEDAREALAEAERLSPHAAGVAELRARLADFELVDRELPPPSSFIAGRWIPRFAAIVTIGAVLGWVDLPRTSAPLPSRLGSRANASRNQTAAQHAATPVPASLVSATDAPGAIALSRSVNAPSGDRQFVRPAPAVDASALPKISAFPEVAPVEPPPVPTETPAVPFSSVLLLTTAPAVPPPVTTLEPPPALPAVTSTDPTPPRRTTNTEEEGVRAALARYESAYSQLDLEEAVAVWPGVDRKALASVFNDLASQRVSLGTCDVRVIAEVAVAECVGSTTSTRRTGGSAGSQLRRWQFRLRNLATGWQIVGATVQ